MAIGAVRALRQRFPEHAVVVKRLCENVVVPLRYTPGSISAIELFSVSKPGHAHLKDQ